MKIIIPKSYWRIFLMIFFEVVFGILLYQAIIIILHSDSPHPWLVGDWLINYQGGVVRRGLIGEIAFQISQLSGINIVTLIVVFQTFLYLVFLLNAYRLSSKSPFSPLSALLIFSPAFILFPVLDPIGAFRKEILLFALLSAVCIHLTTANDKVPRRIFTYIGIAAVFIALSHEMLSVYFPYIIAAIIIHDGGLSNRVKNGILAILPAIAITILVMLFGKGDNQTAIEICNSLSTNPPPDCISPGVEPGAISFLGEDLISAHDFVVESLNPNTIFAYAITAALAFTPLVLMYFSKFSTHIRDNLKLKYGLGFCVFITIVGSIPLFLVVADYGRLIYIHVTCLSLVMLMGIQERDDKPIQLDFRQISVWTLALLYIIGWRLIHWEASLESSFPLLTIIARLTNL